MWQIAGSMRILAFDLSDGDLVHLNGAIGMLVACAKINEVLHAVVEVHDVVGAATAHSVMVVATTSSRAVWLARCVRLVAAWCVAGEVIVALL